MNNPRKIRLGSYLHAEEDSTGAVKLYTNLLKVTQTIYLTPGDIQKLYETFCLIDKDVADIEGQERTRQEFLQNIWEGSCASKVRSNSSICWDRDFRLWVRCEICDQHPDGLEIRGTYVRFASAVRTGQKQYGYGMFHVDHQDPEHMYTPEEQSLKHDKPSFNGKHKIRTYAGPYLGA